MTSPQRRYEGGSPRGWMDRMFDEWWRTLPLPRPWPGSEGSPGDDVIRVDEFREGDHQVIRAELPDIDPEKDVDVTVRDGMLRIAAQRRVEEEAQEKGYTRRELRYGSFSRTLPLPDGAEEKDIRASYKDGILEIRVPVREPAPPAEPTKISISRG
jgi:HSP20 family protein